jgi:hypothetical protein
MSWIQSDVPFGFASFPLSRTAGAKRKKIRDVGTRVAAKAAQSAAKPL